MDHQKIEKINALFLHLRKFLVETIYKNQDRNVTVKWRMRKVPPKDIYTFGCWIEKADKPQLIYLKTCQLPDVAGCQAIGQLLAKWLESGGSIELPYDTFPGYEILDSWRS